MRRYDAAICIGVLPHIPAEADATVLDNLRDAVRPGGLVVVEARNELFSLFTLNRYSRTDSFVDELIAGRLGSGRMAEDEPDELEPVSPSWKRMFRIDLPPVRSGKAGRAAATTRCCRARTTRSSCATHSLRRRGFDDVRVLFYHWHRAAAARRQPVPKLQRAASLADGTSRRLARARHGIGVPRRRHAAVTIRRRRLGRRYNIWEHSAARRGALRGAGRATRPRR